MYGEYREVEGGVREEKGVEGQDEREEEWEDHEEAVEEDELAGWPGFTVRCQLWLERCWLMGWICRLSDYPGGHMSQSVRLCLP